MKNRGTLVLFASIIFSLVGCKKEVIQPQAMGQLGVCTNQMKINEILALSDQDLYDASVQASTQGPANSSSDRPGFCYIYPWHDYYQRLVYSVMIGTTSYGDVGTIPEVINILRMRISNCGCGL